MRAWCKQRLWGDQIGRTGKTAKTYSYLNMGPASTSKVISIIMFAIWQSISIANKSSSGKKFVLGQEVLLLRVLWLTPNVLARSKQQGRLTRFLALLVLFRPEGWPLLGCSGQDTHKAPEEKAGKRRRKAQREIMLANPSSLPEVPPHKLPQSIVKSSAFKTNHLRELVNFTLLH